MQVPMAAERSQMQVLGASAIFQTIIASAMAAERSQIQAMWASATNVY